MMQYPLDARTSQQQALEEFWRRRQEEIEATVNFSEREIPMARLKKVICAQKGNMMMTFDTPAFLTKACELFVQELAIRSWMCAESHHRCIILDSDIAEAIATTEHYDFLIDILHAHWVEHDSTARPRHIRKRRRLADEPSASRRPPHQLQSPQFNGYAPHIPVPPCPVPTVVHQMPLSFPVLLQEAPSLLATTVTSTPTANVSMPLTSYITRGATTTLPRPTGLGLLDIPNANYCYMNMINTMNMGNAGAASTSNVAAQQDGLAFNHIFPLQFSRPLPVANNNDLAIATTIELNHVLPEGAETSSTIHDIGVDGQLQQQEIEITIDHHQNVVHESTDVETIDVAGVGGNKYNINGDEVEIFDESLLGKFLEEIPINEELLSPDTTSSDLLPLISTIPDVVDFINNPYALHGVFSSPSTSTNNN